MLRTVITYFRVLITNNHMLLNVLNNIKAQNTTGGKASLRGHQIKLKGRMRHSISTSKLMKRSLGRKV